MAVPPPSVIQQVESPVDKIHGLKYSDGYYYAVNRGSPAYILKIDERDINSIQKEKLYYVYGTDIEIVNNKIYIICSEGVEVRYKDSLAPHDLLGKPDGAGNGQSLCTLNGFLYAAYLNGKFAKMDLRTEMIAMTSGFSFHSIETDGNYIFGTDEKDTIRKLDPDTLVQIKQLTRPMSWICDEMVIHGDYVFIGSEVYSSKAIVKIKKDLSTYEDKQLDSGTYFVVSDGIFLYAGPSAQISSLWRLNFDLSDSYTLSLPSPLKAANEMTFGAESRALISTWTTPAYFALIDLSPAYIVTCDSDTYPNTIGVTTGCDLLKYYDADKDGDITLEDVQQVATIDYFAGKITMEELTFIQACWKLPSPNINEKCRGCYAPVGVITCGNNPFDSLGDTETGCKLLLHYDADKDGIIDYYEMDKAYKDWVERGLIEEEESDFVSNAFNYGSINDEKVCPGCYTPPPKKTVTFLSVPKGAGVTIVD